MDPTIATWMKSVTGIVAVVGLIVVPLIKRTLGNVTYFKDIPTWLYALVSAVGITLLAKQLGYLVLDPEYDLVQTLMTAGGAAATAGGFFNWINNPTDAIKDSAPAMKQRGEYPPPVVLLALALGSSVLLTGCGAKVYHGVTVGVVTAHTALKATQDVALQGKCGEPTAPPAPVCLSNTAPAPGKDSPNVVVHKALSKAFEIDGKVATAVRDWPLDKPMPSEIPGYLAQITTLINDVIKAFPDGALKSRVIALIGDTKK